MEYKFTRDKSFNKGIFLIALIFSLIINLGAVYIYGYSISNIKAVDIPKIEQPKVKFLEIKEENKKKIAENEKPKKEETPKKKTQQKSKPVGKEIEKKPVIPLSAPLIPEAAQISEKEVNIPEENIEPGSIGVDKINIGKELEYKPVLKGEFNPAFGTKLTKFDETAFGPASGRLIVYKPEPPIIKTTLPPPPKIKVKLWINTDGTVDKVDIIYPKALGDIKLKQIIEDYVLSWKFNAISSNEKQWAVTTIRFQSKQ
jgi:protein TonB